MLANTEYAIESVHEIGGVDGFQFEEVVLFTSLRKKATFIGVIPGSALIPRKYIRSCAEDWIKNEIMDARNRPLGFFIESDESSRTFNLGALPSQHAYIQDFLRRIPDQQEAR